MEIYPNIRNVIGSLIGKRVSEITQEDWKQVGTSERVAVYLHFDDGSTLQFYADREAGFWYDGFEPQD